MITSESDSAALSMRVLVVFLNFTPQDSGDR